MYVKVLTVSDINRYIKRSFDNDCILQNCSIKGEISNIKFHSSGHVYFSLKDEFSKINCIMFRSSAKNLQFIPENGMRVILKGRISLYEKEGSYQLYCTEMKPDGVGELYIAFEKLKSKLEAKGMFDTAHKKSISNYTRKIGIVTSTTGAAIRDIINVTKRRNRHVELVIYPSLVQGAGAAEDIVTGINKLNSIEDIDLIILARGGGSIEDLWCFNDERVAEAVYNSEKPIITGVGHEIDYTIVDFVADRRAPTPSAAAEIAVFDSSSVLDKLEYYSNSLKVGIKNILEDRKQNFTFLKKRLDLNNSVTYIANQYIVLERLKQILNVNMKSAIDQKNESLIKSKELLKANNPFNILNRGYSIIEDEDKNVIGSMEDLEKSNIVNIVMKDGECRFNVSKINNGRDDHGQEK